MNTPKPLIVFDVNETLVDLESVTPVFERIFGQKGAMRLWFANLILYSQSLTQSGTYVAFTDIGAAVLEMLAKVQGITVTEQQKQDLTNAFASMPPHPEVPAALAQLRNAGFRLFTLTDNTIEIQMRQLKGGGIADYFERHFSAGDAKTHKPNARAYGHAEHELDVSPSRLLLIASHTWDTQGALGAGWHAALIKRPLNDVLGVGLQPDVIGTDLKDVAEQLITRYE
ncbi:MAG: haloacid dehalogenase type II [Vulcanimicrobiaceae bacterium]|jgi:2-haloacid dehalogenase